MMNNCSGCVEGEAVNWTTAASFSVPTASLGLIVSTLNIIVNFSVLIIFLKSKSVRANRHHNLVICLCICDFGIGMSGLLASLRLLIPSWSRVYIPCLLSNIFIAVGIFMSLLQTFLISFHRFLISIGSPWNDYLLRGKRKYVIYAVSWSLTFILQAFFISPTQKDSYKICSVKTIYNKNLKAFMSGYGVTTMIILLCTILLYVLTLNNVRKRYIKTYAWQIEKSSSEHNSNENRLQITEVGKKKVFESLKTVGIILGLLILLTGPFILVTSLTAFDIEPSHTTIFIVCVLTSINSVINPFVYSWKIDSLRKEFKLLFQACLS